MIKEIWEFIVCLFAGIGFVSTVIAIYNIMTTREGHLK